MKPLADLLIEAQHETPHLVVSVPKHFCANDGKQLFGLTQRGVRLYQRAATPTCLDCGFEHHPRFGFGSRHFDGVDDKVALPDWDDLNAFTAMVWVKNQEPRTDNAYNVFAFDNYPYSPRSALFVCYRYDATTASGGSYCNAGGRITWAWTANEDIWRFVEAVRGASGTSVEFFFDSASQGTVTVGSGLYAVRYFNLGYWAGGSVYGHGVLAHFALYNVALTANERLMFKTGLIPRPGNLAVYLPLWGTQ